MPDPTEVITQLEGLGTERTRLTYLRHGAPPPLLGVTFGDLRPIARRLGRDQGLARSLWASGVYEARLLACMVADPLQATEAELDAWLDAIDDHTLVDVFVAELATRVPGRRERAERWIESPRDRTAQAGWDLMNAIALSDEQVPDAYLAAQLELIAGRMQGYGNWTRRSASNAITGIGLRNDTLEAAARATAASMGYVDFDPGPTACVMPDPIAYLEKTKAHRAAQTRKREARTA